jgi:glycosyltransferase involved in cell wall biosynthesis
MLSVLLFPPLSRALSARGRREVLRFSWRQSAERVLDLYRDLTGEGRRAAGASRAAR